jgi:hypothetical protein
MLLTSTADKVQLVTSAAIATDVHATYLDHDAAASPEDRVVPGRRNTAIATATTTDIVTSPGTGVTRNVREMHVRNKHATDPQSVTVRHTDGTVTVELCTATLLAGERLSYSDGRGFEVYDAAGALKPATASVLLVKRLGADQSNSTVTPTEVTGLTLRVEPGTYTFKYSILYRAAATTTGVRFSVNHDGTVTSFVAEMRWVDVSATAATAAADQDAVLATGSVLGAMAARAKSTAGWGTTISVDTADADMLMIIEGLMVVTVAGDLELWHGSEVAAASTVKAGSVLVLTKVA